MPELPEVETIRGFIDDHIRGKMITQVETDLPRLIRNTTADRFATALTGQTIEGVSSKGQYLFIHCSGPWSFLAHMRMTGSLLYEDHPGKYAGRAVHITFTLSQGWLLYRDIRTLGCLWLVPSQGPTGIKGYDSLGPDAISTEFTEAYLYSLLKQTSRPVKTVLMDQSKIAGLGNIYVDEALFRAGIRPMRHSDKVTKKEAVRLHEAIVAVLREGLEHGGTTIRNFISGNGKEGQNQDNLRVYGREGMPCTVCGTTIEYTKLNGRGTHYCPKCQT